MTEGFARVGTNGLRLHYQEWGAAEAAHTAVLVHGLGSSCHIWDLTAPTLASEFGLRVLALDQRGHGLSDQPSSGYDFPSVVADLVGFLDALGVRSPALLVGHSWGASVVLHLGVEHAGRTAGVVLVDGGVGSPGERWDWSATEERLRPPDIDGMQWTELRERMARSMSGSDVPERMALHRSGSDVHERMALHRSGSDVHERMARNTEQPDSDAQLASRNSVITDPRLEAFARSVFDIDAAGRITRRFRIPNHMQVVRALWEQRPAELLESLAGPLLVLPARRSSDAPEMLANKAANVQRALELHRSARVRWFEETVHDIPLQRPAELAAEVGAFASAVFTVATA